MGYTQEAGARAERAAAEWLMDNGFRVVNMNWRVGRYEIDIVAERAGVIHFVEVKCRRARSLTKPEDAITPAKFASLQKAASAYIATYDIDLEIQFDVIAVELHAERLEIRHIPSAMTPNW